MADILGTPGNDTIVGSALTDIVDGGAGNDLMFGYGSTIGALNPPPPLPVIDAGGGGPMDHDTLVGGLGNDTVRAGGGDDTALGGAGLDQLFGDDGNDFLDGGLGADKMAGGLGNDTYIVDAAADLVTEAAGAGVDTVQSSVSLVLAANLEQLTLLGTANLNATGNVGGNVLVGNAGANKLDGKGGADSMDGGNGDDLYVVDDPGDKTGEASDGAVGGTDLVLSSVDHVLGFGIENLTLTGKAASTGAGNGSANLILGNAAANTLSGGGGNDTLNGAAGADRMAGGKDDDIYYIDNKLDAVSEAAGEGTDTIRWLLASELKLGLFAEFENATLLGTAAVNLTGTGGNNVLQGNAGANKIDGQGGFDFMAGGGGNDIYMSDGFDSVVEFAGGGTDLVISSFDFALGDNVENLTLTGTALLGRGNDLANVIIGTDDFNLIIGGKGADTMAGGKGDDEYFVDNVGDKVIELAGGGLSDTVVSSVTHSLGKEVEILFLKGIDAINGVGNASNNKLSGNDGNNLLDGKGGADTLDGGLGNDILIVDHAGDVTQDILFGGGGTDLVLSSVSHSIGDGIENLSLTGAANASGSGNALDNLIVGNSGANTLNGNNGADTLVGGAGNDRLSDFGAFGPPANDRLDGGAGADTMDGGSGNDVYIVDNVGDRVDEEFDDFSAGFNDRVESSVTFVLTQRIENLTLTGAAAVNGTGSTDDNVIIGNGAANRLAGLEGADTLEGGGGNDTLDGSDTDDALDILRGGAGNDLYIIGFGGDQAIELDAAGGIDTVLSIGDFTLGANLENLTLGVAALTGTGNVLANVIIGNGEANVIDGGLGADKMSGGKGDDIYAVDNAGDVVIETAGGGIDTVFSSVNHTLAAGVERLFLSGGDLRGTGNSGNNSLIGGAGNDTLDGKAGADVMEGGGGNDLLFVDNIADVTSDTGGGTDEVRSSVTHAIGTGIENLVLSGAAAINGTGNAGNNAISGNRGANSLAGGLGDDTLTGGGGNDTLNGGDGSDDFVFGPTPGKDLIRNFSFADTGTGVDQIDISDLLVGFIAGVSSVADFVQIAVGDTATTLRVDANGLAGGSSFADFAVIDSPPPGGISAADIVANNLILA